MHGILNAPSDSPLLNTPPAAIEQLFVQLLHQQLSQTATAKAPAKKGRKAAVKVKGEKKTAAKKKAKQDDSDDEKKDGDGEELKVKAEGDDDDKTTAEAPLMKNAPIEEVAPSTILYHHQLAVICLYAILADPSSTIMVKSLSHLLTLLTIGHQYKQPVHHRLWCHSLAAQAVVDVKDKTSVRYLTKVRTCSHIILTDHKVIHLLYYLIGTRCIGWRW
jgi:hypothetical protein